ncbi:MAG TPA: hypothetical protein VFD30_05960 [Terriglobia bacterium]|nr:hypothetical protein [Terriglobia bacterium]
MEVNVDWQKGFQQAWFLIVPPDSEARLPTEEVVRRSRQRMQIEQCVRDWKRHRGLHGLHLLADKPQRLLRLLMAFTLAWRWCCCSDQGPWVEKLRPYFEVSRPQPRHGTRKVLSALLMALYLVAEPRWAPRARSRFVQILSRLTHGQVVALLDAFSP